jgi:two-component system nitrogen regulation sensor histidine kinase NtrY
MTQITTRAMLAVAAVAVTSAVAAVLLHESSEPVWWLIAVVAAGGSALGWVVLRVVLGRMSAELSAVDEGLLRLQERDYGSRVTPGRRGPASALVERFNALSQRLRAEHDDVFQRELLLETLVEGAPTAIVLCNDAGRVVLSNGAARELLFEGQRPEGSELSALLGERPELSSALIDAEDGLVHVTRAGQQESLHVSRRYFTLSTQRHTLYLVKPMTRELSRQETEAWKKAIRIMSHEMNNSLAAISSMLHSGRTILAHPEQMHRMNRVFDTLDERSAHLREFLEGYAAFARLPRPSLAPVALRELLDSLRVLYPFTLRGELPGGPIVFDAAQVQQALINLLKNAHESGSPKDAIELEVMRVPGGCALCVLDRGSGMSDEALARAREPFFSTKKTGSGLGLALSREIAEGHGGRLDIERRDGGVLRVCLELPSPEPEAPR